MKNIKEVLYNLKLKIQVWTPRWLCLYWYRYLFEKRNNYYGSVGWISTIICRCRNHPDGLVYYNPYGLEPDMHCKNCGDDLG